jgi:hypothetical protein
LAVEDEPRDVIYDNKKFVETHTTVLCIGWQFCAVPFFERCKMRSSRKNYLKKNKSSNEV